MRFLLAALVLVGCELGVQGSYSSLPKAQAASYGFTCDGVSGGFLTVSVKRCENSEAVCYMSTEMNHGGGITCWRK